MTDTESANLAVVRSYLTALESGALGEALARFFTDDAQQVEFPNRLNPSGGRSDLQTLLSRAEQGQRLLRAQHYEIRSEIAQRSTVAVEAVWTGTLSVALGSLSPGASLRAHFAMFFELESGRIRAQRNYDCFESW
jgi:ketosteroid isomerase-like protein